MRLTKRLIAILSLAACLPLCQAQAQGLGAPAYPNRPLKILVGFPPGGAIDAIARLLAQRLEEQVGQPAIVENRTGASGQIAMEAAARAAADGYIMILADSSTLTIAPNLKAGAPFDVARDFTPIALVAVSPFVLVVNAKSAASNLPELLRIARANPGQVRYGSSGSGTIMHLIGELLRMRGQIDITHIPYRGGGPATIALLANEIELLPAGIQSTYPHIKAAKLKALAVTAARRHPLLPDIPTTGEAGLPEIDVTNFFALLGPANMPAPLIQFIAQKVLILADSSLFRQKMIEIGAEANPQPAERLSAVIAKDHARWQGLIKAGGIVVNE